MCTGHLSANGMIKPEVSYTVATSSSADVYDSGRLNMGYFNPAQVRQSYHSH